MKINQYKGGIIINYISLFLGNIISIIYTPIMLRLLGQSEYGLLNLSNTVISYLGLLNMGMGASYIRYYSRYKSKGQQEKISELNSMYFVVFFALGVLVMLCGSIVVWLSPHVFASNLDNMQLHSMRIILWLSIVNLAISFPLGVFRLYTEANERFVFLKVTNILFSVMAPLFNIPVLLLGYKSVALTVVSLSLNLATTIMTIAYSVRVLHIKFNFKHRDYKLLKEIFVFSSFLLLNQITDIITWSTDKILLGAFCGTSVVAIYAIASQFNLYFQQFVSSIYGVFVPRINLLVASENKKDANVLFNKLGRIQFFLVSLILSGFCLFGKEFIKLWAGKEYSNSYYVALLLMIPAGIPYLQSIGIEIQKAMNKHKFRSILLLLIAILNFVISIPLSKNYGEIGAALGTSIALVIGPIVIMNIYYHKVIKLNMFVFWREIASMAKGMIVPVLFTVLVKRIIDFSGFKLLVVGILTYSIAYIASFYLFSFNQDEKRMLFRWTKRK